MNCWGLFPQSKLLSSVCPSMYGGGVEGNHALVCVGRKCERQVSFASITWVYHVIITKSTFGLACPVSLLSLLVILHENSSSKNRQALVSLWRLPPLHRCSRMHAHQFMHACRGAEHREVDSDRCSDHVGHDE